MTTWTSIGIGYPGGHDGDLATEAAFDILAPVLQPYGVRTPVFCWGGEVTPTPEEVWRLADKLAGAVQEALPEPQPVDAWSF